MTRYYGFAPAFLLALAGVLSAAFSADAEVKVSLTIEGDLEELRAVLDQLRRAGFTGVGAGGDPLELRIHSTSDSGEQAAAKPAEATEGETEDPEGERAATPEPAAKKQAKPALALVNPEVRPRQVAPGEMVYLTVEVVDERQAIDTLAAQLKLGESARVVDLHDNGTHGDQTAGDNVWTVALEIPPKAPAGTYQTTLQAYGPTGMPLAWESGPRQGESVSAETEFTVAGEGSSEAQGGGEDAG